MKQTHFPSFHTAFAGNCRRTAGITLVELLVVIVIIATLAALSMMGVRRAKFSAAKVVSTNQLRQISVAVNMWAAEKNLGEPFYAANGTGTFGHESVPGANPEFAPGNPPMLLYNKQNPESGYLTDLSLFFSPMAKEKAPTRDQYKPEAATEADPWGTYGWFYPCNGTLTPRQLNAMGPWAVGTVSNAAKGKLLMANEYINSLPNWDKHYLALMIDGSVNQVAQSEPAWTKWAWSPTP